MDRLGFWDILQILLPKYGSALSGDSHDAIVAVFVSLILVVAVGTLVWTAVRWVQAQNVVGELNAIADELHAETLAGDRMLAVNRADGASKTPRDLWREFDESLVAVGDRVMNTERAEDYFNPESIAPRLVANRMLATMPSVLTALGLLGTFIGLAVGLSGLNLSQTTDVDELRQGIESMVTGAALGFTASVWGVFFSVVVNIVEKTAAGRITARISKFQARIDELFRQHSPEQALVGIEQNTRQTSLALEELHEKIGAQFQQAIGGMSTAMQEALAGAIERSIAPTMETLADRASGQSAEIFESLVGQFADGFKAMGSQQADEMSRAAETLQSTLAAITDQVGEAISEMQEGAAAQTTLHLERAETFQAQLAELTALTGRLATALEGSLVSLGRHLEAAADGVSSASTSLVTSSSALDSTATAFTRAGDSLSTTLSATLEAQTRIVSEQVSAAESLRSYTTQLDRLGEMTREAATRVSQAAQDAGTTFDRLKDSQRAYLDDLSQRVTQLSEQMSEWLTAYSERVTHQTNERMTEWDKHTREFAANMLTTSEALSSVVDEISEQLEKARG